jgi:hypothetical protein
MRNESDERGIKLMTRSPWWKDYTLTTDIELLMQSATRLSVSVQQR